jgi:hypothetical protein
MKANNFFAVVLSALTMVGFIACDKKSDPANYKLSQTEVSVEEGATFQLAVVPAAQAVWSSSKVDVATVDQTGLIKGIKAGNSIVKAVIGEIELSALVTVTAASNPGGGEPGGVEPEIDENLPASLKGKEYYLFQLDETTAAKLKGRIKADLRVDDTNSFLYVWEGTYVAGEASGKNFYGEAEGWPALQVANVGWSGMGVNVQAGKFDQLNAMSAIMADPSAYVLHLAMKSTDNATHLLELDGTTGKGKVAIGASDFIDNGVATKPVADFTRNGSWGEIEIPMTTFTNQGLVYGSNNTAALNVLVFLSGGTPGTMLQYDACFIYKK